MLESVKKHDTERAKFLFNYELTDPFKRRGSGHAGLRERAPRNRLPSYPRELSRHRF
jgi:hypothetical protein